MLWYAEVNVWIHVSAVWFCGLIIINYMLELLRIDVFIVCESDCSPTPVYGTKVDYPKH
jgi:hypothetical protein